jgi:hypothetical protein
MKNQKEVRPFDRPAFLWEIQSASGYTLRFLSSFFLPLSPPAADNPKKDKSPLALSR